MENRIVLYDIVKRLPTKQYSLMDPAVNTDSLFTQLSNPSNSSLEVKVVHTKLCCQNTQSIEAYPKTEIKDDFLSNGVLYEKFNVRLLLCAVLEGVVVYRKETEVAR
ncbi:uncharacterized protein BX663DRAFT_485729 [Cokeromyces recurvatus]|uniref:uncharacterized protein n=1 Tax=Cokeromyces recurvatus TaxID=90255 RepID=UPI002220A56A|nr:uncharacterized protein BX663DRAFT_485729 [Cokeromyces recurvatus]KAI7903603.1 hypothetical protein BX663DRAFT_485729 [Cokeromyces recurvatus]